MKKKLFTLLLALVAIATTAQAQVVLNETNFPDPNFRAALIEKVSLIVYSHDSNGKCIINSRDIREGDVLYNNGFYDEKGHFHEGPNYEYKYIISYYGKNYSSIDIHGKSITNLKGIEFFTDLGSLSCYGNQLTSLNVSKNTALKVLWCWCNNIKGEAMDALVTSLPTVERGQFVVISTENKSEGNFCTKSQVAVAKGKGWEVYDIYNWNTVEYEGIENVTLNAENFPDANFRAALAEKFGISEGDEISAEMIAATTSLNVNGQNKAESEKIADLTGIEHFTALSSLVCYYNRLTSLDVSKNTKLGYLECLENQLTSLDVSKNTKLTTLYCDGNQLTSLDVSKNTYLQYLTCNGNQLTSLDVSKNTMLCYLQCEGNLLTSLDVSKNAPLWGLYCSRNQLTSLDVSKNTKLRNLHCDGNQLTSLNVSNNTALAELFCYGNQLTSLDVSKNIALTYLFCDGNQLTSLDVSKNTKLTDLRCYGNQIKGEAMNALVASLPTVNNGSFFVINTKDEKERNVCTKAQVAVAKGKGWKVYDFHTWNRIEYEGSDDATAKLLLNAANFPDANFRKALTEILGINEGDEITAEMIVATTELDVSNIYNTPTAEKISSLTGIEHFTSLTRLKCGYNQLNSLDLSKNTALTNLSCGDNYLTALDVSKNTALTYLSCGYNQLTLLNVSGSTALTELHCGGNNLTSLDVSKNTALIQLSCDDNYLAALDVSKNAALERLWCYDNQLTSLDVSKNTGLIQLECDNNQLTLLNVSKNTTLGSLNCSNNQLTSLDVSKNTALKFLYCSSNQLTSLDVSKNTVLQWLTCGKNQLTSLNVLKNTALKTLYCYSNQIKGEAMDALVASLPMEENGKFYVIDTKNKNEKNVCTKEQVAVAKSKGWIVYDMNGSSKQEYEGSDDDELEAMRAELLGYVDNCRKELQDIEWRLEQKATYEQAPNLYNRILNLRMLIDDVHERINDASTIEHLMEIEDLFNQLIRFELKNLYIEVEALELDIDPVDEDDNVDFGEDMDENDDLDGNIIGDIFYNIGNGNGEYNAEEGCIVLKKTTDDETVDGLSGKDIFGEDFKGQFTGIVFKVPSGKGTVKVTAETTGNMLLKVKIGDGEPVEMELNGKLKISFPYNVSETTFVAIYAGANNEAKAFGTTNATEDAALKIYGIEFLRDETTAIHNSQFTIDISADSWYTIDGVKLNGEPTKKGIYIRNGNKVVK